MEDKPNYFDGEWHHWKGSVAEGQERPLNVMGLVNVTYSFAGTHSTLYNVNVKEANWKHRDAGDDTSRGNLIAFQVVMHNQKYDWIEHDGKGIPPLLHANDSVEVQLANGQKRRTKYAALLGWMWTEDNPEENILRYRHLNTMAQEEAVIENYMDGKWHNWYGGAMPVPAGTRVPITFGSTTDNTFQEYGEAEEFDWEVNGVAHAIRTFRVRRTKDTVKEDGHVNLIKALQEQIDNSKGEWVTVHGSYSPKGEKPKSNYVYEMQFKMLNGHPDWSTAKVRGR